METLDLFKQVKNAILTGEYEKARELVNSHDCEKKLARAEERTRYLEAKLNQFKEAEQLRVEFLATISHELRTPLNSIIGYNSLLEEGVYGNLNHKQIKALHRIDQNATRLLTLINQLIDLSRLEAGATSIFREETNLSHVLHEILEDYQGLAEEKGLNLEVSQPYKGVTVNTDAAKVREIFRQLISNALKFTQAGQVHIELKVEKKDAVVRIQDTGNGIPEEKRDSIFELFRQGEAYLTRQHEGAGLGLAIVRKLADLLCIQIDMQSEVGKGSTFTLTIPNDCRRPPEQEPTKIQTEEESDAKQPPSSLHEPIDTDQNVLIVDDDPYMVEIFSDFLENRGHYRVTKAYSGMHAMIHLAQSRPDYLLVDLMMPRINGERVIQTCRDLWGNTVKIIVITGKDLNTQEIQDLQQQNVTILKKGDYKTQNLTQALSDVMPIPCNV